MIANTFGASVYGVNASLITVEVSILQGVGTSIVGLADNTVEETLYRIDDALKNTGYWPSRQKTVINLTPSDMVKASSIYDLPIALCLLAASGEISFKKELSDYVILGELASNGQLRPVKGVLPISVQARKQHCKGLIVPVGNALEASIVNKLPIYGVSTLQEAICFLQEKQLIEPTVTDTRNVFLNTPASYEADFSQLQGQGSAKRALEIAAAGGHNVILVGPPEVNKTVLAKRLPSILPPLTLQEAFETTKIYSVAGKLDTRSTLIVSRPYRNPHHSISDASLVGGGKSLQPGEVSLAHNGVLFLDELPEFNQTVLDGLGQPLEEHKVVVSHTNPTAEFPASFMFIASMNPCPCGYYNQPHKECVCGPGVVQHYLDEISSSLFDHIDLHVEVRPDNSEQTASTRKAENSSQIRERVSRARERQLKRFDGLDGIYANAMIPVEMVSEICVISEVGKILLKRAMERSRLSARAYDPILKMARTIADLAESDEIRIEHLAEAVQYRGLDRENQAG